MAGEISLTTLPGSKRGHATIFVGQSDAERAMQVLRDLAANAE